MENGKIHSYVAERGMLYVFGLFMAGYFLLPMAAGHRRVYYFLVLPAALVLWRELAAHFRGNRLSAVFLAYATWMMLTLAWTADFQAEAALWQVWLTANLLSFIAVSGYLWVQFPELAGLWLRRLTWLAGAAAVVSIFAWYARNPFPASRLEPLGVMHHQNKAGAAYGLFLVLAAQFALGERDKRMRLAYFGLAAVLGCLVLFTQSRTALAGVCVGLLVVVGWRALLIVVPGLLASLALLAANPQDWWHRVESFSFRPGIWKQVITDMNGHWWTGHGYLVDPHVQAYGQEFNHAHNSYLASLRDGGLVGLLLLLAMMATALYQAWKIFRDCGERLYLALLLYGMTCIFMDFDRLFVHPKEMWLYLWLPLALVLATYPRRMDSRLPRFPVYWRV